MLLVLGVCHGNVKKRIREMRVGNRIDSDHQLVEIKIKEREKWRREGEKSKKGRRGVWMRIEGKNSKKC